MCLGNVADRCRESPYTMISVEEALQIIGTQTEPLNGDNKLKVAVKVARGRILDDDLYSKYDLPPFRASIKDGYAVIASEGKGKKKVLSSIKAGDSVSNTLMINIFL